MELASLIRRTRSTRRFDPSRKVSPQELMQLAELARLCASAGNLQPVKFVLCTEPEVNRLVFSHLAWAAYLKDWPGPAENERPAAYVLVLHDTEAAGSLDCDHGIAAWTVMLGAGEMGLAGCILGAIRRREELAGRLGLPATLRLKLVVALGAAAERVVLEEMDPEGDVRYWRDDESAHHVPKRPLREVVWAVNPLPRETDNNG